MEFINRKSTAWAKQHNLNKFKASVYDPIPGSENWNEEQLLNAYIKEVGAKAKYSYLIRISPVLAKYLDWCIEKEINFYSPKSLNEYTRTLLESDRFAASTLNKQGQIVLAFWNYCYGIGAKDVKISLKEIIKLKETVNKKFVMRQNHVAILLDPENLNKIEREEVRDSIRHMVIFLWHTGMRVVDGFTAKWEWIDWTNQVIRFVPMKTSRFEKVIETPMSDELVEYLKDRKLNHPDGKGEYICARAGEIGSRPKKPGIFGQVEHIKKPLNEDYKNKVGLYWYIKDVLQPLYPDYPVNTVSFRYGMIQRLIEGGVNEKVIVEIYGWSSVRLVSRYTNIKELSKTEWKKAEKNILDQAPLRQLV